MDASPPHASLIEAFAAALGKDQLSPDEYGFASQVLEDAHPDDLPDELTPRDFAAVLAGFWSFAGEPKGDTAHVRLRHALGADGQPVPLEVLEIVQDDAPFLVDSVLGELGARRLELKGMVHPVLTVARDAAGVRQPGKGTIRESLILVLLAPVGDDRREAALEGVRGVLADVHAAVEDFPAMTALMRQAIDDLGSSPVPAQTMGSRSSWPS